MLIDPRINIRPFKVMESRLVIVNNIVFPFNTKSQCYIYWRKRDSGVFK